jgi:hypothetical protein
VCGDVVCPADSGLLQKVDDGVAQECCWDGPVWVSELDDQYVRGGAGGFLPWIHGEADVGRVGSVVA